MNQEITELKGVGERVAKLLAKLDIHTAEDLVYHFPRRYEDYSVVQKIESIQPGPVTLEVSISSVTGRYVRRGLHITEAILTDDTGSVKAVWFNQPYRAKQLTKGAAYFCSGTYDFSNRSYSIMNPSMEKVSDFPLNTARILPVYPETKGLKSHQLRKLMAQVDIATMPGIEEYPFIEESTHRSALELLHFPRKSADIEQARQYFDFLELFEIICASSLIRSNNKKLQASPVPFNEQLVAEFVQTLPFQLTGAQRKVAWQAFLDMQKTNPMNRLVEGDVGSGKTVVAALLALNVVHNGSQVAVMAPTEVLAQQHLKSLVALLPDSMRIALYTGSNTASEKKQIRSAIEAHDYDVVIGTHSLIQDSVAFKQLDLVVIDEQHRFGVEQRAKLVGKSHRSPHILSMTATPIPRTLALTVFGDLDISVIDEMPAGRKRVKTKLLSPNSRKQAHNLVAKEVIAGRQAFIIYPLVEDSEKLDLKSATTEFAKLQKTTFKDHTLGLLHGKMKPAEKDAIMHDFNTGKIDILVSTTVVEVGVDVPNATVMVIEGAERFGLAQLHQLRGRVGRGDDQAYCVLVPSSSQGATSKRLRALETMQDGFELAEYDLELRGAGAIYGTMQHGELDVRLSTLLDAKVIARAQELANELIATPGELEKYPRLMANLSNYRSITHLN